MKTILFISHKMNLGGTEKSLLSLLEVLQRENLKITLLLLQRGGVLEKSIPNYIEVIYLDHYQKNESLILDPPHRSVLTFISKLKLKSAFLLIVDYLKIKWSGEWFHIYKSILAKEKNIGPFHVAIAYAGPENFITYYLSNKIKAAKKIQWIHFDVEKVLTNFNFGKKFYPLFDKIFCVSNSSREIFIKHFPKVENKTEVFENIVSSNDIRKLAEVDKSFNDDFGGIRILTVGRFTKEKGQHLIPEVAEKLRAANVDFRWYLVGDGSRRKLVEQCAQDLEVQDKMVFLGEQENPYPYMKDCDIYVQPSLHEGYGITVAEAKVFCKPIVLTNFASAKDLVVHQETGLIVDINSNSIFEGINLLMSDTKLRHKLASNLSKVEVEENSDLNKLLQLL